MKTITPSPAPMVSFMFFNLHERINVIEASEMEKRILTTLIFVNFCSWF